MVWETYCARANAENQIKELKYDFCLDSFCIKNFWGTEATFRVICMAYNLMALFRILVLKSKQSQRLSTLRFKCFALGAWIVKHAHQTILKVSVSGEKRRWIESLFDIAPTLSPPFVISNA